MATRLDDGGSNQRLTIEQFNTKLNGKKTAYWRIFGETGDNMACQSEKKNKNPKNTLEPV